METELDFSNTLYIVRLKNGTKVYARKDENGRYWRTAIYGNRETKQFRDRMIPQTEIVEIVQKVQGERDGKHS